MTFTEFYQSLLQLAKSYDKKTQLKIEYDSDNDIIKIFGEKIHSIAKAKNGLNDVIELAYTTAEHHPYWNLLYNCSQISKTILDRWDDNLTKDELEDIKWSIKELKHSSEKLQENKKEN